MDETRAEGKTVKPPKFLREFSKQYSQEERNRLAREIRDIRLPYSQRIKGERKHKTSLQEQISQGEIDMAKELNKLSSLKGEIAVYSSPWYGSVVHFFTLRRLSADLQIETQSFQDMFRTHSQQALEQRMLDEQRKTKVKPVELQEAQDRVAQFYQQQKRKWEETPYSKADMQRYFSEEYLSSLSLADYILLLKRFPSHMVTHVIRQGIRDHTGHEFHRAGLMEYSDSFLQVLRNGRLKSALAVYFREGLSEDAVLRYLTEREEIHSKKEALAYLEKLTNLEEQNTPGSYADSQAVHFAVGEVADMYYGSERGNEIFVAFPSAMIASQYFFGGKWGGNLIYESGGVYNDRWVWDEEQKGISINTGVVFIPADTRVDPRTGSKYQLDKNNKPVNLGAGFAENIKNFVADARFDGFTDEMISSLGNGSKMDLLRKRLVDEFGITYLPLQKALLEGSVLTTFRLYRDQEQEAQADFEEGKHNLDEAITEFIARRNLFILVEAQDTVSSYEYWENYFKDHPSQRPSKIVYYTGGDPSKALRDWRQENGLVKTAMLSGWQSAIATPEKIAEAATLGFRERHLITGTEEQAIKGMDRFKSLASEVIEEHFDQKVA